MFTSCKVVGVTASAVIRVILLRARKVRLLTYFFNLEDFINALTHIYLLSLARNQPHPSLFLLFFVHLRGRGLVLFSLPDPVELFSDPMTGPKRSKAPF